LILGIEFLVPEAEDDPGWTDDGEYFLVGGGGGGEDLPLLGDSRARLLDGTGETDLFGERARFICDEISLFSCG